MGKLPISKRTKYVLVFVLFVFIYDSIIKNANIPVQFVPYFKYFNWFLGFVVVMLLIFNLRVFKSIYLSIKGNRLFNKGNYEEALEIYNQIIKARPGYPNPLFGRAGIYIKLNRYEEALADLNNFISHYPQIDRAYFRKGVVLLQQGELQESTEYFTKALELNPVNAVAYCSRGVAYYKMHELDKAFSDYSNSIKIKPELAVAHFNLSGYYASINDRAQAVSSLQTAVKLGFTDVDTVSKADAFDKMKDDSDFQGLIEQMKNKAMQ